MKWKRWLRRCALGSLCLLLLLSAGTWIFLRSSAFVRLVERQLAETLNTPVRLGSIQVNLWSESSARQLTVFARDAEKPWLAAEQVRVDLHLLGLLTGQGVRPSKVHVQGVHVHLDLDERGKILTQLPRSNRKSTTDWPAISVENANLTVAQVGRPPLHLSRLNAELDSGDLSGELRDPEWGNWTLRGQLEPRAAAGTVSLETEQTQVTTARLRTLPFVPSAVWQQLQAEGSTRVSLQVRYRLPDDPERDKLTVRYHLDVQPDRATVHLAPLKTTIEDTTGRFVLDNGLLSITQAQGTVNTGKVRFAGDLDFRPKEASLAVKVGVEQLDLAPLASQWEIPQGIRELGGRLTGQAELSLVLGDKLRIDGQGQGQLIDATVLGNRTTVGLTLQARNNRLSFEKGTPSPAGTMARSSSPLLRPVTWVLSELQRGIRLGSQQLVRLGTEWPRGSQPGEEPARLDVAFTLTDVDLADLVRRAGLKLSFPVAGLGTLEVQASVPVDRPRDLAAYRARGKLQLRQLRVAELTLDEVQSSYLLDRGRLSLRGLSAKLGAGTLAGETTLQLAPLGSLVTNVEIKELPLEVLGNVISRLKGELSGRLDGKLRGTLPLETVREPATWRGEVTAAVRSLRFSKAELGDVQLSAELSDGEARLSRLTAKGKSLELNLVGKANLREQQRFELVGERVRVNLALLRSWWPDSLRALPPSGELIVSGKAQGRLSMSDLAVTGNFQSDALRLGEIAFEQVRGDWQVREDRLQVMLAETRLAGGSLVGSVDYPLKQRQKGEIKLNLQQIDVGDLARTSKLVPVRVLGKASGSLQVELQPEADNRGQPWQARVELTSPRLKIDRLITDRLSARLNAVRERLDYRLEGSALGGSFELEGEWQPPEAVPAPPTSLGSTRIKLRRLQLARLIQEFGGGAPGPVPQGRIDLELTYQPGKTSDETTGSGKITISDLMLGDALLSSRLTGRLRITGAKWQLQELTGSLAGGFVRLRGGVQIDNVERSWFVLQVERAESARLFRWLPDWEGRIAGPLDLNLRGNLGREWRATGELILTRGRIAALEVTECRLPVTLTFVPMRNSGTLDLHDVTAQLGTGRVSGQGEYHWGAGNRLSGQARFSRVELRSLIRSLDSSALAGLGSLSGRLAISGQDVRSTNDIQARVEAHLDRSQALETPVLKQLAPYLRLPASTSIEEGDIRAVLGKGIWRLERLSLQSELLRLFAEGTITSQGRLELRVIARTGQLGINPLVLRALGVATVGPLSAEALTRASNWLSNRVLHLRVTGTVNSPTIRIEPLPLLTEEIVRYFLSTTNPAAGLFFGNPGGLMTPDSNLGRGRRP